MIGLELAALLDDVARRIRELKYEDIAGRHSLRHEAEMLIRNGVRDAHIYISKIVAIRFSANYSPVPHEVEIEFWSDGIDEFAALLETAGRQLRLFPASPTVTTPSTVDSLERLCDRFHACRRPRNSGSF